MPQELVYFPAWAAGRRGYSERIRELFREQLAKSGLRPTRQRERILDALLTADRHLSLEDLYGQLKGRGIGRATIFRTLRLLEDSRLVERVTPPSGAPRFEVKGERPHHDHLICVGCGGITEVRWPEVEKIQERVARQSGFSITWHRHEVFGRCRACRAAGNGGNMRLDFKRLRSGGRGEKA